MSVLVVVTLLVLFPLVLALYMVKVFYDWCSEVADAIRRSGEED